VAISDLALLSARLLVGLGLAAHGAQKAFGWFGGSGPDGTAAFLERLGFRPGARYARAAAANELAGGTLLALGAGGPLGSALALAQMVVAMRSVNEPNGFFAAENGVEVPALYAAAALMLAAGGPGRCSLDSMLRLDAKLRNPLLLGLAVAGAGAGAAAALSARTPSLDGPATPTYRGKNSPLPADQPPARSAG
jgi:putative oxidoreductase